MARPVLGIATTHIAAIVRSPQIAPPDEAGRFRAGFETLADALARAAPDALVVISPDHVNRFFLDNMPAFCIGLRDSFVGAGRGGYGDSAPPGHRPRAARDRHSPARAGARVSTGRAPRTGSWTTASWCLSTCSTPGDASPVVPINVNCAAPPLPGIARCHTVGALLGEAIRAAEDGLRVAVIAAGGLSHSPGDEQMGLWTPNSTNGFWGCSRPGRPPTSSPSAMPRSTPPGLRPPRSGAGSCSTGCSETDPSAAYITRQSPPTAPAAGSAWWGPRLTSARVAVRSSPGKPRFGTGK